MKPILIFVEGEHDRGVIGALGLGPYALERIGPGKKGLKAFMQGYADGATLLKGAPMIGFRDRDFDYPIPNHPQLIIPPADKGRIFVSYRTTIENYLLLPENLRHLHEADNQARWTLLTAAAFDEALYHSAVDIRCYQAARHALGETRRENALGTSWMDRSGNLPEDMSETACLESAWTLLETHLTIAEGIASRSMFEDSYHQWLNRFDTGFFEARSYLEHFHGKDLAQALMQQLAGLKTSFPLRSFLKIAIKNFDYHIFPDLVELHQRLAALIKEENS